MRLLFAVSSLILLAPKWKGTSVSSEPPSEEMKPLYDGILFGVITVAAIVVRCCLTFRLFEAPPSDLAAGSGWPTCWAIGQAVSSCDAAYSISAQTTRSSNGALLPVVGLGMSPTRQEKSNIWSSDGRRTARRMQERGPPSTMGT